MALKMGSNSVGYTGQKAHLELPFLEINFYPTVKLLLIFSRVFLDYASPCTCFIAYKIFSTPKVKMEREFPWLLYTSFKTSVITCPFMANLSPSPNL